MAKLTHVNRKLKRTSRSSLEAIVSNANLTRRELLIFYLTYYNYHLDMPIMFPEYAQAFRQLNLKPNEQINREQLADILNLEPTTVSKLKNTLLDKLQGAWLC